MADQGQHPYTYAGADPVNGHDPTGEQDVIEYSAMLAISMPSLAAMVGMRADITCLFALEASRLANPAMIMVGVKGCVAMFDDTRKPGWGGGGGGGPNPGKPKLYVLIVGDPGAIGASGVNHDVGHVFELAAATEKSKLEAQGDRAVIDRESTRTGFESAFTSHGTINGGVFYFGHGALTDAPNGNGYVAELAVGERAGRETNFLPEDVPMLSNRNLGPDADVTLYSCYSGASGSIHGYRLVGPPLAQLMANRLRRTVNASTSQNGMCYRGTAPSLYPYPCGGGSLTPFAPQ